MGKDSPSQTTTYQRQSLPGYQNPLYGGMSNYFNQYIQPGAQSWGQPLVGGMGAGELGGLNTMGSAVGSLFGMGNIAGAGGGGWNPYSPSGPTSGGGWSGGWNIPSSPEELNASQPAGSGSAGAASWLQGGGGNKGVPSWGDWAQQGGGAQWPTGGAAAGASVPTSSGNQFSALPVGTPTGVQPIPGQEVDPGAGLGGAGGGMGGMFGAANNALNYFLSPQFSNPQNDPYFQQNMDNVLAQTRQRMGSAGLNYGTSLADAEMRGAADVLSRDMARRQAMQAGLGQFGVQFPMQMLGQYQQAAGLPRELQTQENLAQYQEWLRTQGQGRQDLSQLLNWGMGMAGQPMQTSQNSGQSFGLGNLLGMFLPGLLSGQGW